MEKGHLLFCSLFHILQPLYQIRLILCRVDFKTGKVVASKTGMVFMRPRRPKLIQPGCFEGPAAAWAPRRCTYPIRHRLLCTLGLFVNTTFGEVPFSGLLSTRDTVPSMCRQIHTRVPFAHSVVQRTPSTSNRPREPTTEPFHSDHTSSHHPSCGGCRNLHWPDLILSVQTFRGMS